MVYSSDEITLACVMYEYNICHSGAANYTHALLVNKECVGKPFVVIYVDQKDYYIHGSPPCTVLFVPNN